MLVPERGEPTTKIGLLDLLEATVMAFREGEPVIMTD
jgi:hypothetical protein